MQWPWSKTKRSRSVYLAAWHRARARAGLGNAGKPRPRAGCPVCLTVRDLVRDYGRRLGEAGVTAGARSKAAVLRVADAAEALLRLQGPLAAQRAERPPRLAESRPHLQRLRGVAQKLISRWRNRRAQRQVVREGDVAHVFRARAYSGSRSRHYVVHVPSGYDGSSPAPLVMVLHGCRQTHHDIQRIADFDALADRDGFLVVYPFVTSYTGMRNRNCWGWWFANEIHAGAGEVEDLWQIIREVRNAYNVDRRRIHVTGLSSGAGMAVALMVARSARIASGAAVAGVPYAERARAVGLVRQLKGHFRPVEAIVDEMKVEMGPGARPVPILIVHSHDDATVNIQAARNLRDSWAQCFDIDTVRRVAVRRGQSGTTRWEHTRYRGPNRRTAIETLFLEGPGHGWYGGRPGRFSYPAAPNAAAHLWEFFQSHPAERPVADTAISLPTSPDAGG